MDEEIREIVEIRELKRLGDIIRSVDVEELKNEIEKIKDRLNYLFSAEAGKKNEN